MRTTKIVNGNSKKQSQFIDLIKTEEEYNSRLNLRKNTTKVLLHGVLSEDAKQNIIKNSEEGITFYAGEVFYIIFTTIPTEYNIRQNFINGFPKQMQIDCMELNWFEFYDKYKNISKFNRNGKPYMQPYTDLKLAIQQNKKFNKKEDVVVSEKPGIITQPINLPIKERTKYIPQYSRKEYIRLFLADKKVKQASYYYDYKYFQEQQKQQNYDVSFYENAEGTLKEILSDLHFLPLHEFLFIYLPNVTAKTFKDEFTDLCRKLNVPEDVVEEKIKSELDTFEKLQKIQETKNPDKLKSKIKKIFYYRLFSKPFNELYHTYFPDYFNVVNVSKTFSRYKLTLIDYNLFAEKYNEDPKHTYKLEIFPIHPTNEQRNKKLLINKVVKSEDNKELDINDINKVEVKQNNNENSAENKKVTLTDVQVGNLKLGTINGDLDTITSLLKNLTK